MRRRTVRGKSSGSSSPLRSLAAFVGILDGYRDMGGVDRTTSDGARRALLAAMGIDASTPTRAAEALKSLRAARAGRLLDPLNVVTGPAEPGEIRLTLRGIARNAPISITLEDGEVADLRVTRAERSSRVALGEGRTFPFGMHEVTVHLPAGRSTQRLIVAPDSCPSPESLLNGRRVWGVTANLYSVRSSRNAGVGNVGDLSALLAWTASHGGAFVGVNPLHAIRNIGDEISPYGPVSRLFRNPIYIDPLQVPECDERCAQRLMEQAAPLREGAHVDYEGVLNLLMPMLRDAHRRFTQSAPNDRRTHFDSFCAGQGEALQAYATFSAIEQVLRSSGAQAIPWQGWPEQLRVPDSQGVRKFASDHAADVEFYKWVQFELDRQLAVASQVARSSGMPIGLYQDLAIATPSSSSDVWSNQDLFTRGVSLGAPPDMYSATGQTWGLVPLNPMSLTDVDRMAYWQQLVKSAFRHSGALRMDHVLGLFRQFWIPDGASGKDGAYVKFPRDAMLAVVALEARRAGAIVVGEDLGTVPPEVPPTLRKWNMLSSKVVYFEQKNGGAFRGASEYPREALATVNTHDHAPVAGFWRERDIEMRSALGSLPVKAARSARKQRIREKEQLLALLAAEGLLTDHSGDDEAELIHAVHAFARRTPCWLVGLSLDDLAAESEPVNIPGVPIERHRSWSRKMSVDLEELLFAPRTAYLLGEERRWRK